MVRSVRSEPGIPLPKSLDLREHHRGILLGKSPLDFLDYYVDVFRNELSRPFVTIS